MTIPAPRPADADDRLDLHNSSVEESAVAAGHCGMTDLRTGRVCHEPRRHAGGCAFVASSTTAHLSRFGCGVAAWLGSERHPGRRMAEDVTVAEVADWAVGLGDRRF
jgi:hypothetical protein